MTQSFASRRDALLRSVHLFLYVLDIAPDARALLDAVGYTADLHARGWALFWELNDVRLPGRRVRRVRGWKPAPAALAALEALTTWFDRWSATARDTLRDPMARRMMELDAADVRAALGPPVCVGDAIATPVDATLFGQGEQAGGAPVRLLSWRLPRPD